MHNANVIHTTQRVYFMSKITIELERDQVDAIIEIFSDAATRLKQLNKTTDFIHDELSGIKIAIEKARLDAQGRDE